MKVGKVHIVDYINLIGGIKISEDERIKSREYSKELKENEKDCKAFPRKELL